MALQTMISERWIFRPPRHPDVKDTKLLVPFCTFFVAMGATKLFVPFCRSGLFSVEVDFSVPLCLFLCLSGVPLSWLLSKGHS